mmetsp:Transcript_30915/g.101516  ORF Transcript_30915/g.101516 Transcript_30915/m.101516 type:complete len:249 (+) Transcript_30915:190-936(+)
MSKGGGYLSSKEMRRGRLASSASLFGVSPGAALASASLRSRSRAADASSRRSRSATRASRGSTWPARCSSLMMVAWMFASSKSMPLSSAAASPAPLCELASSSTATAGAGSGASHPAWDAPSSSVASLRDRLRWYWSSEHPKLLDMRASSSGAAGAAPRAAAMAASTADSPTALRSPADAASAADASSSSYMELDRLRPSPVRASATSEMAAAPSRCGFSCKSSSTMDTPRPRGALGVADPPDRFLSK